MKRALIILCVFLNLCFFAQEQEAEFTGGSEKMMQFISNNLRLPDTFLKDSTFNGCKTIVKFVIDSNGKVSNEAIARECLRCPDCDREALRVIAAMPSWKPALKNGKSVASNMALPIFFTKPLKNAK